MVTIIALKTKELKVAALGEILYAMVSQQHREPAKSTASTVDEKEIATSALHGKGFPQSTILIKLEVGRHKSPFTSWAFYI